MAEISLVFHTGLIFLCICYVLGEGSSTTDGGNTEGDRPSFLTRIHNAARMQVAVPASNMEAMRWDLNLSLVAQNVTDTCKGMKPNPLDLGLTHVGMNLFSTTDKDQPGKLALVSWRESENYYNYENNSCEVGRSCDEYLELIQATTQDIGCGITVCENETLVLCIYQHGKKAADGKPYIAGDWCSGCVDPDVPCQKRRLCLSHSDESSTPEPGISTPPTESDPGEDSKDEEEKPQEPENKKKPEEIEGGKPNGVKPRRRYRLPAWSIFLICIISLLIIVLVISIVIHSAWRRKYHPVGSNQQAASTEMA